MKKLPFLLSTTVVLVCLSLISHAQFGAGACGTDWYLTNPPDKISIGVACPLWKLDVSGDINLNGTFAYKLNGSDFIRLISSDNVILGISSISTSLTTSNYNVLIGNQAGQSLNTTGSSYNSFLGYQAGLNNTSGSYNSYFGYNAGGSPSVSNSTALGCNAQVASSNSIVLGDASDHSLKVGIGTQTPGYRFHVTGGDTYIDGKIGIGTTPGSEKLKVSGDASISGYTTVTTLSSGGSGSLKLVLADNAGKLTVASGTYSGGGVWQLVGNYSTSPATFGSTIQDYMGTGDNHDLVFATYGVEGMRLKANSSSTSGNLGIGIDPYYKLDVDGDINFSTGSILRINGAPFLSNVGTQNLFVGLGATGTGFSYSTFAGYHAGNLNTGNNNTFIGNLAGTSNTSGVENTYVGSNSGSHYQGTTANYNTFVGYNSGNGVSGPATNMSNTFIGHNAGYHIQGGSENTATGKDAGNSLIDGDHNTFIGKESGTNTTTQLKYTPSIATIIGTYGSPTTVGDQLGNTFIGQASGRDNTQGDANVFSGSWAGKSNTVGIFNCFYGHRSGENNLVGSSNTMLGCFAGMGGTSYGTVSGSAPTFEGNVFVGSGAGQFYDEAYNTFVGTNAASLGRGNVLVGYNATGGGAQPGALPSSNWYKINHSVALGEFAAVNNACACTTAVEYSMAIGPNATVSSGATPLTYATAIGANADVTSSNTMALGGISGSAVQVVIGLTAPSSTYTLEINGSGYANSGTWTPSDERYKKNIRVITNSMDILRKLRPIKFEFKENIYREQKNGKPVKMNFPTGDQIGFIAQELRQYIPEAVMTKDDGYLAVNFDHLFGILVKGIQEQDSDFILQKKVIDSLLIQNQSLFNSVNDLNNRISTLEQRANNNQSQLNKNGLGKTRLKNSESSSAILENISYLEQNAPNPFRDITTIGYFLTSNTQKASLLIFDMNGSLLKSITINQFLRGTIQISGGELKPGMYIYSLIADEKEVDTKKLIIIE